MSNLLSLTPSLINLLTLVLISLVPLVLSPLTRAWDTPARGAAAKVGFWYNVFVSWPLFAACFAINAVWGPGLAKRAQAVMHPTCVFSSLPDA